MKTTAAVCFVVQLGLVFSQNGRGPCGCRPVYEFCANDYTTYHSICEYKCRHPSTPFQDWYILYHGPCVYEPETQITPKRYAATTKTDEQTTPKRYAATTKTDEQTTPKRYAATTKTDETTIVRYWREPMNDPNGG